MENFLLCGELSNSVASGKGERSQESEISSGTFGLKVYKGRRKGTVEFFGIWKHHRSMKEKVENGVRIMHSLDHTNVLKFYEWYETPKHIWVITELASGGTLYEILEQDVKIPPDKVEDFIRDIASGLNYLHSVGIVYSDLQPKKIMLDTREYLKLSDFTLARLSHDPHQSDNFKSDAGSWFQVMKLQEEEKEGPKSKQRKEDTQEVHLLPSIYIPSPFYAAPELYVGSTYSTTTDMWSLGCILFEMLTGRQPFCACSLEALEKAVCDHSVNPDGATLGAWSKVVHGLLRKTPLKRYSWKELHSILSSTACSLQNIT